MQNIRKGESMKEERVESIEIMVIMIFIIIILFMAWLAPIVLLSHKIDEVKDTKQEIVIKIEYATPIEPPESALEISTNY